VPAFMTDTSTLEPPIPCDLIHGPRLPRGMRLAISRLECSPIDRYSGSACKFQGIDEPLDPPLLDPDYQIWNLAESRWRLTPEWRLTRRCLADAGA
jgi:hypothetical protein